MNANIYTRPVRGYQKYMSLFTYIELSERFSGGVHYRAERLPFWQISAFRAEWRMLDIWRLHVLFVIDYVDDFQPRRVIQTVILLSESLKMLFIICL